jgi:acetyltransferase-like isoleucine patch superfamily enzyme
MREVIMPKMSASMVDGTISKWFKAEGEKVKKGEPLFEILTEKASIEVEAEVSGVLHKILVKEDETVPIAKVVALIEEEGRERVEPQRIRASPAAKRLAEKHNLDLRGIRGSGPGGLIVERDLTHLIKPKAPAVKIVEPTVSKLNPDFLLELKRDREGEKAFGRLSSALKAMIYRQNGAKIGEGVKFGKGTYVISEMIEIDDGVMIGEDSFFQCKKLRLGKKVCFGKRTEVIAKDVVIGNLLFGGNDICIGKGGTFGPNSQLMIGEGCYIGDEVHLNPAEPIIIGNQVCLSSRVMVYTHGHWQSVLKGYSVQYAPVKIEDNAWVGLNCTVLPGVTIGEGSTIISNSLVATDIPRLSLAGGVPAKVLKTEREYPRKLSSGDKHLLMKELLNLLSDILKFKGYGGEIREEGVFLIVGISKRGEEGLVIYGRQIDETIFKILEGVETDRIVLLSFNFIVEKKLIEEGRRVSFFDLEKERFDGVEDGVSDEVREFLRRRGIRFRPILWRYEEGLESIDRFPS